MTSIRLLLTLLATGAVLLGGCAGSPPSPPVTQKQRLAALAPWAAKGELIAIEVPAASSTLSNQMNIIALKAGTLSNSAQEIVGMLRNGRAMTLAVLGDNQAVNAATVQSALKKWGTLGARTATAVLLVGEPEDAQSLKELAAAVGVRLEIAPIR